MKKFTMAVQASLVLEVEAEDSLDARRKVRDLTYGDDCPVNLHHLKEYHGARVWVREGTYISKED